MLGLPRSHWERDEPSWLQPEVREIDSALCLRLMWWTVPAPDNELQ